MASCPHCGKPISQANPKFCPYCGKTLQVNPVASAAASPASGTTEQSLGEPSASSSSVTSAQAPPKETGYATIADEIRKTPPNVLATFAEVMNKLSQTNKLEVYLAVKKQIERTNLIYDYGFFSVAEVFVDSRIAPGDIVLYAPPIRLQSNDIVLTCWPDKDLGVRILHMVASSFGPEGMVEVKDSSGNRFQTSIPFIIGRFVHRIDFDSQAWRDMLGQLAPAEFLTSRLKALRDWYQNSTAIVEKDQRIQELDRRLAILSKVPSSP